MKNTVINFDSKRSGRRTFVKQGLIITLSGMTGVNLLAAGKPSEVGDDEGQKVSPPEDLMQEHGLLNRILLIYDTCKTHLINNTSFPIESLSHSSSIVRTFVEDYHEKQEENYLFPRFKKAGKLVDLVDTLLQQHNAGRKLTDQVKQLSAKQNTDNQKLIEVLTSFNRMYRPHEAREDTVLFPAFRKIVSKNEYDSLGEQFEKNEHKLFGDDGFEKMVNKVADIEKTLGIYELSQFTPKV